MSRRTKVTLVSLPMMMLPYRIEYPLAILVAAAIISIAEDSWDGSWISRKFHTAFHYVTG